MLPDKNQRMEVMKYFRESSQYCLLLSKILNIYFHAACCKYLQSCILLGSRVAEPAELLQVDCHHLCYAAPLQLHHQQIQDC